MPLWVVAALLGLVMVGAAGLYATPLYWWAKQEAFLKRRAGALLLRTPSRDVEHATLGAGLPILVMHGAGGSYRQGLTLAQLVDTRRFQIIGMSRPGYRGTPLNGACSFEEQADLAATLLDHLKIEKAAVIGVSAGGTPAFQFALRHPDRCLGLILLSAALPVPGGVRLLPIVPLLFRLFMSTDFFMWLALNLPLRVKAAPFGWIDPARLADERFQQIFTAVFDEQFPLTTWRDGVVNDLNQYGMFPDLPCEDIRVPALVIHGTSDRAAPFAAGQNAAKRIPNAKLLAIERGTHFVVASHWREIGAEIERFVSEAAS